MGTNNINSRYASFKHGLEKEGHNDIDVGGMIDVCKSEIEYRKNTSLLNKKISAIYGGIVLVILIAGIKSIDDRAILISCLLSSALTYLVVQILVSTNRTRVEKLHELEYFLNLYKMDINK